MNEEFEVKRVIKKLGEAKVELVPNFYACPNCGDSLQTVKAIVPNHGERLFLYIGWCMDCLDIRGTILTELK